MTARDFQSTTSGDRSTTLRGTRREFFAHGGHGLGRSLGRTAFACTLFITACGGDAPVGPTLGSPTFDGNAAMEHVRTQVAFGPRVPGTPGHAAQLDWMLDHLGRHAPVVVADTGADTSTFGAGPLGYTPDGR